MEPISPLLSVHQLHELVKDDSNAKPEQRKLRVVDLRTRNGSPKAGLSMYREAHIPGALHLDLETQLSAEKGPGRHPLPTTSDFLQTLSRAGLGPEHTIVCYNDVGGAIAARLWWMLSNLGVDSVGLLDGGLQAWQAEGLPMESTTWSPPPVTWPEVHPRNRQVAREELSSALDSFTIVDARAAERYRGEVEPLDPVAGHIPGAISAPFAENLTGGHFKSPEELRARFTRLGISSGACVVHSCGSGVTACHNILAMRIAGLGLSALYPGSWSDWCRSGLPIE